MSALSGGGGGGSSYGGVGPSAGSTITTESSSQPPEVVISWQTVPTSKNQCMNGGWQNYTDSNGTRFKNQGDCVSYVATGGKNKANG